MRFLRRSRGLFQVVSGVASAPFRPPPPFADGIGDPGNSEFDERSRCFLGLRQSYDHSTSGQPW